MMGTQKNEAQLFSYAVNLEKRVRANHPLRRRLWRQKIQDYLIAAVQNVRILLAHKNPKRSGAIAAAAPSAFNDRVFALNFLHGPTAQTLPL
jgi:hypothetical protein